MDNLFYLILLILIFLPVIFFLWVAKTFTLFLFRMFSPPVVPPRFCKTCGSELNPTSMQCYNCGKNLLPTVSKEAEELRIALAQLEKLMDRDEVSKEASAAVVVALQNRLAKISPVPIPPILPAETLDLSQLISVIEDENIPPVLPVVLPQESKSILEEERPVLPFPKITQAPIIAKPQRSLAGVLNLFLESRNILLGELVGGLLIVGGSVALVATLWNSLEQIPYFPFLMLAGISALLFFAGQYTLHHWKLQSTSRGMLVISILLAVLSLLVLANLGLAGSSYWIAAAV
ncbi:MAG: zinc ribbon domain-containing protein, partial [Gemmataceae bacterium]|nr:zinc ribbon domain-containing protein [Gemmataceae bacterium]